MGVKRETYIVIQGWMRTDLNLSGNELILFALIYGFCQREQRFTGSLTYIMNWLNTCRQTTITLIKSLIDKGLIIKHEYKRNNVRFNEYEISETIFEGSLNFRPPVQILDGGSLNSNQEVVQKLDGGSLNFRPNNTINSTINNSINTSINRDDVIKIDPYNHPMVNFFKKTYKTYFPDTCLRVGTAQINKIIEIYSDYQEEFAELVIKAFEAAKELKWDKCDPTNVFWMLDEDNLMKLATGMYKNSTNSTEEDLNNVRKQWLEN